MKLGKVTKRMFLVAVLLFAVGTMISNAQCVPGAKPSVGIVSPDTVVNLPYGAATQFYQAVLSIFVPKDTVYNGFKVPVDSIGLLAITGLPSGFTYSTNSSTNYWDYKKPGCIVITGNPQVKDTGKYKITFQLVIKANNNLFSLPYGFTGYKIVILDKNNAGVEENTDNKNYVAQNSPNPFSDKTIIKYYLNHSNNATFNVYDIYGKVVYSENLESTEGINNYEFFAKDLSSGIYYYEIKTSDKTELKKMIISKQ